MLTAIFTAISTALVATAPSYFGEEFRNQNDGAPLYLWVPGREKGVGPHFQPPMGMGAGQSQQEARALFGREVPVRIECWGADGGTAGDPLAPYANAEALFQALAQEIQAQVTPASFKFLGGGFEQEAVFERSGRIYHADFLFRLQVQDAALEVVPVSSFPITEEVTVP
ncbi:MAG: hypothetical protein ACYDCP_07135 [Thermoplasmataceae archaeon]